ncbi:DUF262 domain-containing protein [Herbaspirillum seropedicae]|uniref:DUF262 domain-containing protein n=1 Tax=Herbaspirillum seropedicae TaxID=964 RepID=UPI003F8D23D0
MISDINNEDADGGGLWLPNIQRLFVWSEDQIERLFDSIVRQYPLPSMMIWKTKMKLRNRYFIHAYQPEKVDLKSLYRPLTDRPKRLVLDGQQRLQSLYIGLKGSIDGRSLHFDLLSGDEKAPDEIKYRFSFIAPDQASWPWANFGEIIYSKKLAGHIVRDILAKEGIEISEKEKERISDNIERAQREFEKSDAILYQDIDGISGDEPFLFDDIIEIFIRANSGGTRLSKSDLMFTLLIGDWDIADIEMQDLLSSINGDRFDFTRDFVLKTALAVLDQGARYNVDKLRDENLKNQISDNWKSISRSISFVRDFLIDKTFIRSDQALASYNALIPLIYLHYHYPNEWGNGRAQKDYLLRVLLAGAFSGQPDGLVDKINHHIKEKKEFNKKSIFRIIQDDSRSLQLYPEHLYKMGYGSKQIHLLFNLWYPGFDYQPALDGHLPQVDHIFPQSELKSIKEVNPETNRRSLQVYPSQEINQLANCMLLTARENGASNKNNILPDVWFSDKDDEYLARHCIPKNKRLWNVERYRDFIEARKKLIQEKFLELEILYQDE